MAFSALRRPPGSAGGSRGPPAPRYSAARDGHDAEPAAALGGEWPRVTAIEVYTAQPIHELLDDILRPAGAAAIHGLRWYLSRPPIQGLEFEMDLRGVGRELVL